MNNFDPTSEEPQDELRKLRFLKKQEESRARKAARNKAWYERQKAKREELLKIRLTIVKSQQSGYTAQDIAEAVAKIQAKTEAKEKTKAAKTEEKRRAKMAIRERLHTHKKECQDNAKELISAHRREKQAKALAAKRESTARYKARKEAAARIQESTNDN